MRLLWFGVVLILACTCLAQEKVDQKKPFSVWSVHAPDMMIEGRSPYPLGVLTPNKAIVVRRLEVLSNRGPVAGTNQHTGEPIPCPVQYTLEVSNGVVTQQIPISNAFLKSKTTQTYTDSGELNVPFSAGSRIVVSMIAPKPQFPPVACTLFGLDITIQYELADLPSAPTDQ